jgi:hypothetical protein
MPVYGAGTRVQGARERGGPQPRVGRTLERDETRSREVLPLERGDARPKGACSLERGRVHFEGILMWATSMGRRSPCGPCPAWLVTCMVRLNVFRYQDLGEDFPVV